MKEIRLFDLVKGISNGNLTDEQRAYVQGNKIDFRNINATVDAEGAVNVPEEKKFLDVAIRNASVLNKIGAMWFADAKGTVSLPRYEGSKVGWKAENVAADNGQSAFTETILSAKRLTAVLDVSKTFLAQDSNDAESILISDLAAAVATELDKTIFSAASGDTNTPAGILQGDYVVSGTALTAATYEDVLDLESRCEAKNGQDFIFILNPKVKYAMKGTDKAQGFGKMVFDNGEMDGYKAVVSNSVADKGIICMDPRDLAVAVWNGVEITVDTVSRAIYNEVRIVVNYLCDAKLRGPRISGAIFS